eukprot:gb/GECG01001286.1/.p1 GENE.gb/GECG01001286.1/~~gb/GECG01001286.1/.p1  ORF type:complete len:312 (+),score=39.29 gb/GECG01001286.1/:1-936(+)
MSSDSSGEGDNSAVEVIQPQDQIRNVIGNSQWWGAPRPWWTITRQNTDSQQRSEDLKHFFGDKDVTVEETKKDSPATSRQSLWKLASQRHASSSPEQLVNAGAMAAAGSAIEKQHNYLSKHGGPSILHKGLDDPSVTSVFGWSSPQTAPMLPWIPTALQGQPPVESVKDPFEIMNSCPAKTVLSFVLGGGLGVATGVVVGGFQSSSPPMGYPGAPPPPSMTALQALKDTGDMMVTKSKGWAKNFAKVGAIYSTVECILEKGRAQHDMQNSVYAGCITGAALAYKQGPLAMAMGCGGFAAFSVAIELFFPGH